MSEDPNAIAVIIAAYKAERVIGRAIRSALAQPEAQEIIVVVDGSPDGTAEAARACDDGSGRLKVLEQKWNRGPSAARNAAIAATTSPWITVLDDDDFMSAGRLGRLLESAGGYDFIADDLLLAQEGAEHGHCTPMWFTQQPDSPETITLSSFVSANCPDPTRPRRELGFLKPLMRRAFLYKHALFYDETMRLGEDYDLYARGIAAGGRFALMAAQGYVAVRRADSLSGNHGAKELLGLRASDDRLLRSPALTRQDRKIIRRHRLTTDKRYQWQRLIDAVNARNPIEAAACFGSDLTTSLHLAGNLLEQAWVRAFPGRVREA